MNLATHPLSEALARIKASGKTEDLRGLKKEEDDERRMLNASNSITVTKSCFMSFIISVSYTNVTNRSQRKKLHPVPIQITLVLD